MNKFWFPKLAQHIKEQGLTRVEFTSAAYKIADVPKARAWANAMNSKHGISETYAYKCKNILEKLGYPDEVTTFTPAKG